MTGLPMVFAVWAARADAPRQHPTPFAASLSYGLGHIEDIVRDQHPKLGFSEALIREYLTRNIVFELGEREYRGLAKFLQFACELRDPAGTRKASV